MKLYFVRHGHMYATPDTALDPDNGQINEPLDAEGVDQANKLAVELKDVAFDAIISSPLKRAQQTAEIVNTYHNLPIKIDAAWRERDTGGYVTSEVWNKLFNFDSDSSLETSEDLRAFFHRVYKAIDVLKEEYRDKTVLIASHGGVHQALYSYVNRLPLTGNARNDPLQNCGYRIYDIK
ncbi:MAG: histidine phosphatase family protein [Candidatus Microsaccharimonas sp.]